MVKGPITNKSAAGLRRSAIAERLRLREEWSSLKGTDDENEPSAKIKKRPVKVFSKNLHNIEETNKIFKNVNLRDSFSRRNREITQARSSNDPLRGVVALVDVGAEGRALPLRAALTALGATVVSSWGPLVTHLIWSLGGCRDTRAKARALACRVVSPLWVEACASSARRISEKIFPSTARDSDLPSPSTLCRLLKTAEKENWQLPEILDSEDDGREIRLRISSDLEESPNKNDGRAKDSVDIEHRVNTAPRRALPISMSPPPANPKSRRKLFTARADGEDDSDAENTPALIRKAKTRPDKETTRPDKAPIRPLKERICYEKPPERQKKVKRYNLTQEQRKNLENAGRLAKKLAGNQGNRRVEGAQTQRRKVEGTQTQRRRLEGTQTQRRRISNVPKIVLSGMPKSQYRAVFTAIQTLKGIVQKQVNYQTTHVLLGSCKEDPRPDQNPAAPIQETIKTTPRQSKPKLSTNKTPVKPFSICNQCNSPEGLVMSMFECDNVEVTDHCSNPGNASKDLTVICSTVNRNSNVNEGNVINLCDDGNNISDVCYGINNDKRLRTLKTLLGAARGCRVLHAQWALDSLKEKSWLPHIGYEVTHLLKVAQRARVERSAIDKMHSEYGYNVFRGTRVCVTETADQRDAAVQLLTLCGAEILDEAGAQGNDGNDGGPNQDDCDAVVVGKGDEQVCSKWVFDSVAAGRPRTTRRYVNKNIVPLQV